MKTKLLLFIVVFVFHSCDFMDKEQQSKVEQKIRTQIPSCKKIQKFREGCNGYHTLPHYYFGVLDSVDNLYIFDEYGERLTTFKKEHAEVEIPVN